MPCMLITGPSRSGKSEWAEALAARHAAQTGQRIHYIATAQSYPDDAEWQKRIEQHQQRRPDSWVFSEVNHRLPAAIRSAQPNHCLLIDALGTWVTNYIELTTEEWAEQQTAVLSALTATPNLVICVAEEVGWGLVPPYELGRVFRDRMGSLSRAVGEISTEIYLVTAGYALNLTQLGHPIGSQC